MMEFKKSNIELNDNEIESRVFFSSQSFFENLPNVLLLTLLISLSVRIVIATYIHKYEKCVLAWIKIEDSILDRKTKIHIFHIQAHGCILM